LHRLLRQVQADSVNTQSFQLAKGGALKRPAGIVANLVEYGFKAPVAMTLTPWWQDVLPHFKFLHVIRDGRDIALSSNQGPVHKFYNSMYLTKKERHLPPPVKAMKLWSDWNVQVYHWAKNKILVDLRGSLEVNKSFGYSLLRVEDLVSSSVAIKLQALSHLAQWVGSNISEDKLCCLAVVDSESLGSYDIRANSEVSSRFGKWRTAIQNNSTKPKLLRMEGTKGLELFGYLDESRRNRVLEKEMHSRAVLPSGYVCNKTPVECGGPDPHKAVNASSFSKKVPILNGLCDLLAGVDFRTVSGLRAVPPRTVENGVPVSYEENCCKRCRKKKTCSYFTLDKKSGYCFLKESPGKATDGHKTRVSGILYRSRQ
jgi:hypothetical protein